MVNHSLHYSDKKRHTAIFAMVSLVILVSQSANAIPNPYHCPLADEKQDKTSELFRQTSKFYNRYSCFSEGLSAVKRHNKYGFVNIKIEEVIPLQYEFASIFSHGVASVSIKVKDKDSFWPWAKVEKYGFIDKNNQWVIPPTYDYAGSFMFGRAVVGKRVGKKSNNDKMKYGYIDINGKLVIPYQYDSVDIFLKNTLLGFNDESCNNKCTEIVEAQVSKKENGVKKTYLINRDGKLTLPIGSEDNNLYFSEGLARVRVNDKEGFVNRKGEFVIPAIYQNAFPFKGKGQPAAVMDSKTGKWGYIDITGKQVLPFKYGYAESFENGKAEIIEGDGNSIYYINIKGEKLYD